MKKLIIAAMAVLIMGACGQRKTSTAKVSGMVIDSIVKDTCVWLESGKKGPKCELSLNIQYIKSGKGAALINDTLLRSGILAPDYLSLSQEKIQVRAAVDSFVSRFLKDYQRDYGDLYAQDKENATSYQVEYRVKTETHSQDDVLSYIAHIYSFAGGEHGIDQTLVRNFNIRTGRLIHLSDLFVPGYEQGLKEMILEKMCKKYHAHDIEELNQQAIFADHHVYVPDNFLLDGDQITFIYCQDEIAPDALGEIRITFDQSELKKLMKK